MFEQSYDDRVSTWAHLRAQVENNHDPLNLVADFWRSAPYIPYNHKVDPYNQKSWPTPWEMILDNKYDDFTRALMMAYSLKFTNKFNKSVIYLKTLVDSAQNRTYNIVCVDDVWAINYNDNGPVTLDSIPDSFLVENVIEVVVPR
jgi:hypothetical protein